MGYAIEITKDLYYVGVNDRSTRFFENYIPINNGVSYNSYLYVDNFTCLIDTVEYSFTKDFLENIKEVLNGRNLDYLVVQHMEPDHCAAIDDLMLRYPETKIVTNAAVVKMLKQFFNASYADRLVIIKENDILDLGRHKLKFIMTPMVHWPEVMMTYDVNSKILFSADAFGSFGALSGNLFFDEVEDVNYFNESRRYYSNIVGKYGVNVCNAYKKISELEINYICPLHSYIWRKDFNLLFDKYLKWATYEAESNDVVIMYASMYGNTKRVCEILANMLAKKGLKNIKLYDMSLTDETYLIAEIFRAKNIVLASPTYNLGLYPKVEALLLSMERLNVQNRNFALIENGTWAPKSNSLVEEKLNKLKNIMIHNNKISIKSSMNCNDAISLDALANEIYLAII